MGSGIYLAFYLSNIKPCCFAIFLTFHPAFTLASYVAVLLAFYHSIPHSVRHFICHVNFIHLSDIHSGIFSRILTYILAFYRTFPLSYIFGYPNTDAQVMYTLPLHPAFYSALSPFLYDTYSGMQPALCILVIYLAHYVTDN